MDLYEAMFELVAACVVSTLLKALAQRVTWDCEGGAVGVTVGRPVAPTALGFAVAVNEGATLGFTVGVIEGAVLGFTVGVIEGAAVGFTVGINEGAALGFTVKEVTLGFNVVVNEGATV